MKKGSRLKDSIKKHKNEIIIGGTVLVGIGIVVYCLIKKRNIELPVLTHDDDLVDNKTVSNAISATSEAIRSFSIPEQPIEERMKNFTPTVLGDVAGESAQKINKRLAAAGLQTRHPNGEWDLTPLGRNWGRTVYKDTIYNHPFTNNEWSTDVIKLIYSPEEYERIVSRNPFLEQTITSDRIAS